jgi:hypothetical protein
MDERTALRFPILIVGERRASPFNRRSLHITPEQHEFLRTLIRERPQKNGVHDAEDRNVGTNSQREDKDNSYREPEVPA